MLVEEMAIQKLRRQYAFCAARGDATGIGSLFTRDGTFVFCQNGDWLRLSGPAEIASGLSGLKPNDVFPFIQDGPIAIDGDEGAGDCMIFSPKSAVGGSFGGYYQERYRRCSDGTWKFFERIFIRTFPITDTWK